MRLELLTGGEVDAVLTRDGRTFMLQRSQTLLRQHEAVRQAAILDALPACVALVDTQGAIVSVNEVWRRFARENLALSPGCARRRELSRGLRSRRGRGRRRSRAASRPACAPC